MIKQKQLYLHNPSDGVYGDCHRTVIACLLDKHPEEVPNFADSWDDIGEWYRRVDDYLKTQGLSSVNVLYHSTLDQLLASQGNINKNAYYMLSGTSSNGTGHVVICKGGEIYWDPAIDDSGIVGPGDDGFYWVTYLIPLTMTDETH